MTVIQRSRRLSREERHSLRIGLLFISPWVIGFLAFRLIPFIMSFYYSFTFYPVLETPKWIGLDNFVQLFKDPRFLTSLYNTAYYSFFAVPLATFAGILLAMLLNMKVRGMSIWRTIFYLPSITPVVATSLVWLWMFNPRAGVINFVLSLVGIRGPGWLGSPVWAKPALILMSLWGVGGAVVIYLAALQDVPRELVEAAQLDGANVPRQIWHVTLPMISPVILFNVITGLIGAFQFFTEVHVMTGGSGSPADSTMMMSIYLWQTAFRFFKMGYASAQAWVLFVIIVIFTVIMFRVSGKLVYYGGK
ncbi:MAG: Lactose transport system permease protein LacF [Chloroflexi bacterium ADurb.Bin325]|nr:MAG: Lactose transport system permease protein LacF [Chloroflexi bacterium ADurb.Bin325]